jgi:hypothetical protein
MGTGRDLGESDYLSLPTSFPLWQQARTICPSEHKDMVTALSGQFKALPETDHVLENLLWTNLPLGLVLGLVQREFNSMPPFRRPICLTSSVREKSSISGPRGGEQKRRTILDLLF